MYFTLILLIENFVFSKMISKCSFQVKKSIYLLQSIFYIGIKSLISNYCTLFLQFTVRARDQRINEKSTDESVSVNVVRNRFLPVFTQQPYSFSISENRDVGNSVYQIQASDPDLVVSIS